MSVGITDLAHSLRKNTADTAGAILLSHGQQLISAALGHRSLASYQAAQALQLEPFSLDGMAQVIPDYDLFTERASELGISIPATRLRTLLNRAFEERLPGTQVHNSYDAMAWSIQDEMQVVVIGNERVSSEMARANYDGIKEVYFETELEPDEADVGEPMTATVDGHVTLGIDLERPYCGHKVMFQVGVTLNRCGRRCFDEPEIKVLLASLDTDWGGPDDEPPKKPLATALAEELDISMAEAEELTDAEAQALTGSRGEMVYSYLFDFTSHASPELAAKLMQQRGSLTLEVGPWFFENIESPAD